jgi:hypothetical protein
MRLQYEIAIDTSKVRRQLAGVYGDFLTLQRRINSASALGTKTISRRVGAAAGAGTSVAAGRTARMVISEEERASIRSAQRAGNARIREIKREERERTRAFLAKKRQDEQAADMQRRLVARQGELRKKWKQESQERWGNVARGAVGGVRNLVGMGAASVGLLGGVAAAGSVMSEIDVTKRASALANQANAPERKGEIQSKVRGISGATGTQALGALEEWQTVTGDLDLGLSQLQRFSQLALATGTSIDELAAASGNAFNAIKDEITDPIKRLEALDAILRSAAAQGQLGAVEIKQMATEMAALAAVGGQFGTDRQASIIRSIAMAQVARAKGGAPSAAEAVTSVERFGSDIVTKEKDLKRMGVDIWADPGKTIKKDQNVIVADILRATKGDQSKLGNIFGAYGMRGIRGFASIYSTAERKQKGSGEAAVAAEWQRFTGATGTEESLSKRFRSRLEDPDIKIAEAADAFNAAVGSRLVPAVTALIPKLEGLIPVAADVASKGAGLVSWMAANPWSGVGLAAGAGIANELTSAGIATMLKGPFGQVAGQATALAAAFLAGKAAIDLVAAYFEDKQRAEIGADIKEQNAVSKANAGLRANPGSIDNWQDRVVLGTRAKKAAAEAKRLREGTDSWIPTSSGIGMSLTKVHNAPSSEDLSKAKALEAEAAGITAKLNRDAAEYQLRAAKAIEDAGKELAKAAKSGEKPSRGKPMIARPAS